VVRPEYNLTIGRSIPEDVPPQGEFEGDGVVPLRGSAERNEAPRGELDSPLEASHLCGGLWKENCEMGR
jgi:hypothetical protein